MQREELCIQEREFIELIRDYDIKNLTIMILADRGRWHIRIEDHDSGIAGEGHSSDFYTAWDRIDGRVHAGRLRRREGTGIARTD